jgi:hypothetical protein
MSLTQAVSDIPVLTEATPDDISKIVSLIDTFLNTNPSTPETFKEYYLATIIPAIPQQQVYKYGWYVDDVCVANILKAHINNAISSENDSRS